MAVTAQMYLLSLNHDSFCETMSQMLLSQTLLTEFDLHSPN